MKTFLFIVACNFMSIVFFVAQVVQARRSTRKWIRWNDAFAKAMQDGTPPPPRYQDFK